MHDDWNPLSVPEIRERFATVSIPWWVAGGLGVQAIVLFGATSSEFIYFVF